MSRESGWPIVPIGTTYWLNRTEVLLVHSLAQLRGGDRERIAASVAFCGLHNVYPNMFGGLGPHAVTIPPGVRVFIDHTYSGGKLCVPTFEGIDLAALMVGESSGPYLFAGFLPMDQAGERYVVDQADLITFADWFCERHMS